MKMTFVKKIENYMLEKQMLKENSHIVVGLSGGADSVCLMKVLLLLKDQWHLKITAVHVHHGLRGEMADADLAFVEHFCMENQILCRTKRVEIKALSKEWKMSEEETGRKVRYEFFEQVMIEEKADYIAVAHHQDDQAETVLFHMIRGSQLSGLSGILPVRDKIIRPLLCVSRNEIEEFLHCQNMAFCTDLTNAETIYTRNKIRHQILPLMNKEINDQATAHIAQMAETMQDVQKYIINLAKDKLKGMIVGEELQITLLEKEPEFMQNQILRLWFEEKTGKLKDVTKKHIDAMRNLKERDAGKYICLPYQMIAVKTVDGIQLIRQSENNNNIVDNALQKDIQYNVVLEACDHLVINLNDSPFEMEFKILDAQENQRIPQNTYTKWFDYDKMEQGLTIRHRRDGDYLKLAPNGSVKKIRRIMIDDKIPQKDRDLMWMLCEGSHVLWMIGSRRSDVYKITKQTRQILSVTLKEKENGR